MEFGSGLHAGSVTSSIALPALFWEMEGGPAILEVISHVYHIVWRAGDVSAALDDPGGYCLAAGRKNSKCMRVKKRFRVTRTLP